MDTVNRPARPSSTLTGIGLGIVVVLGIWISGSDGVSASATLGWVAAVVTGSALRLFDGSGRPRAPQRPHR
jgi:tetrahydromethanopterin S-methyltransferase subunit E